MSKKEQIITLTKLNIQLFAESICNIKLADCNFRIDIHDFEEFQSTPEYGYEIVHRADIFITLWGDEANILPRPVEFLQFLKSRYTRQAGSIQLRTLHNIDWGDNVEAGLEICIKGCKFSTKE